MIKGKFGWWKGAILLFVAFLIVMEVNALQTYQKALKIKKFQDNKKKFQSININPDFLSQYFNENDAAKKDEILKKLTLGMLYHDFHMEDGSQFNQLPRLWLWMMKEDGYAVYYDKYKAILNDLIQFPVPNDVEGGETISYENSWGAERNYEGKHIHEGTDIMTSNNERGYFPIISMTDGVVEQKGWLEKGGYRIGIRGNSGAYFYYAHLYEYAPDLEVGDTVKAGRLLGSVGDTGYGKEEGTTGKFDVHLHLGVYLDVEGEEMAVNPYFILKALEKKRIDFRRRES